MITEHNGCAMLDLEDQEDLVPSRSCETLINELKFTRAELKNRTGSLLRLEQKIDILNRKLIELDVVKVK